MNDLRTRAIEIARNILAEQAAAAGVDESHPLVTQTTAAIDRIAAAIEANPGCHIIGESAPVGFKDTDRAPVVAQGIFAAAGSIAQGLDARAAVCSHVSPDLRLSF